MKVDRERANKIIIDTIRKNFKEKEVNNSIAKKLYEQHCVDLSFTLGILTGKINIESITDEQLFWLCESIIETYETNGLYAPIIIDDWFSETEIKYYSFSSESESIKYPYIFKQCLEVADDQWVTVLNSKDIMDLYNNQMIHYNKLTQREPTIKNKNGVIQYIITIVKKSVAAISDLMNRRLYIPDDISLNINPENDTAWEIKGQQIIIHEGALDIIDGFHRLMAIASNHRDNPDFNYNMIINIMNFDTEKACRYIAQKDKRNKINKSYSKSLDTTSEVNSVLNRLNETSTYYKGFITRNENALIDWTTIYTLVDYCFKIKTKKEALEVQKYLKSCLDLFIENSPEYLEKRLSNMELAVIIRSAEYYFKNQLSPQEAMLKAADILCEIDTNKFPISRLSQKKFYEIDRRLEQNV